ncbi:molybdenum cofactor guanylyltransferase [Alkalihalobacterium elongatum]|uniref:molybdenum cofactor guanylyltransferase n=1 Tax=Alkalihalobacterium elongatum TaxID=2675466 RepID=UPI001C1F7A90|nr:molybdenum cofactor guanylyltransferase [Alkalihalobacterium elongatum]
MNAHHIVGVLLAGGESRRFGEPKAFYQLDGQPFFQYSLDALKKNADDIIIVSQPQLIKQMQDHTSYRVVLDEEKFRGFGPLAGIYTAMKLVHAEWYVILPCDTPYITEHVIKRLVSYTKIHPKKDAFIPKVAGRNQPLIAVYNRRCLSTIEKNLKENQLKMGMLFQAVETVFIEEESFNNHEAFRNINTKEDMNQN